MSKIRTIQDLSDRLSEDLAWRKKELSQIRSLVETRKFSKGQHDVLLRSGITMLYAHWEGFVKASAANYLEFVSRQRLSYTELSPNFIALAMKAQLNEATQTNKSSIYIKVVEFFVDQLDDRSSVPYENVVQTANLSSDIFKDIICLMGLDYDSQYELSENLIDERLLKQRNTIAHGQYLLIDRQSYIELHEIVVGMMDLFRDQIDNAASLETYRRQSP
jgi:MAE_28990/MAE_18760-like HEPN